VHFQGRNEPGKRGRLVLAMIRDGYSRWLPRAAGDETCDPHDGRGALSGRKLAWRHPVPDCGPVRSWLVIPAMGVVAGAAAVALGVSPVVASACAALAGAALAAVVRALAGDSPAALTGAVIAPLVLVASLADAGGAGALIASTPLGAHAAVAAGASGAPGASSASGVSLWASLGPGASGLTIWAVLALAAAGWTIAELARPAGPRSPLIAIPAAVAGILDPSFIALLAITGARLTSTWQPAQRPRWVLAVPVVGAVAIALAVLGGTIWPVLGARWLGAAHPIAPVALAGAATAALGPLTAVAALAGLAALARPRHAEIALAAAVAGAILVDLRAGAPGPATIGLAAVLAALAIGRLAAMIRLASGQAIAGATLGLLVLLPPVWTVLAHRPAAHIGQASR
jgi:hypothetical protein